ncbi:MAG: 3-deoxy-D-manno-octulosonic acid transferase [Granulosicoccus sp.]
MPTPTRSSTPPWFYRILVRSLSPLLLAYTAWRAAKDGGLKYFNERLGFYKDTENFHGTRERLWIHAASVGEVITVLPLVNAWLKNNDKHVLFTTGTPTGAAVLNKQNNPRIQHQFLPIDFPGACRRFIKQANIQQGWIVETEIWPWLYSIAASQNVSLTIINGRLSDKTSKQQNSVLGTSYKHALTNVQILARSEEDLKKFLSMGANTQHVKVAGDLKYASDELSLANEPVLDRDFVLAASTHADEEVRIAKAWMRARQDNTLLVIAPRHPERSTGIDEQLRELGYSVVRRTSEESLTVSHDIYLADTLGELSLFYQFAKASFVGGSLIERGGHNIMEPARYACPTVVGQHTHNFDDMVARMLKENALTVAMDESDVASFFLDACKGNNELLASAQRAKLVALADQQAVMDSYLALL